MKLTSPHPGASARRSRVASWQTLAGVLAAVLVLSACAGDSDVSEDADEPATETTIDAVASQPTSAGEVEGEETTTIPDQVPDPIDLVVPTEGGQVVGGEVPESIMAPIMDDAVDRTSVDASAITVEVAEEVIWGDGSLGCPQPGIVYTQALIEGYRVVLDAGGEVLDYRANQAGAFIVCDSTIKAPSGLGRGGDLPGDEPIDPNK